MNAIDKITAITTGESSSSGSRVDVHVGSFPPIIIAIASTTISSSNRGYRIVAIRHHVLLTLDEVSQQLLTLSRNKGTREPLGFAVGVAVMLDENLFLSLGVDL